MMHLRTRRVVRFTFHLLSAVCLLGAGIAGLAFEQRTMDMVLLQLVFYGAWACLLGARVGGHMGAYLEEDRCGSMDMGVMSSMGAIVGTLAAGLVGTALTGLALLHPWKLVWGGSVVVALGYGIWSWAQPLALVRLPHLDDRGCVINADGTPIADDQQPLRNRDRMVLIIAASVVLLLVLTMVMALMMGRDLGHPVMMAPMMYGMFGTMLGGMMGGWFAGLLDEHDGDPAHDNPIMVAAMALMAGMMGGMPSGMMGAMMAIMGDTAVAITVVMGLSLPVLWWAGLVWRRYRVVPAHMIDERRAARQQERQQQAQMWREKMVDSSSNTVIFVKGMTCQTCVNTVTKRVSRIPGVTAVNVELASGVVDIHHGAGFPGAGEAKAQIIDLGYEVGER